MSDDRSIAEHPISERELLARFPWIGASRLRAFARSGKVSFIAGRQGSRWYGPAEIAALFEFLTSPAVADTEPSTNGDAKGSAARQATPGSDASGMDPELRELAARSLAATIREAPHGDGACRRGRKL